MAEWYVVRTKPNREEIARLHLEQQQYKIYLPRTIKTVKHARKTQQVKRPLFPGYLFIYLAESEKNWSAIGNTIGTIGPVRFHTYYPVIPNQVIEDIKAKENGNGCIETLGKQFTQGQKVTISKGEWEGLTGIFQTMRGAERSIILLDMLQRQIRTEIATVNMEAV